MTKIIVYGDSYASSENDGCPSWAEMVGKQLGVDVINRAVSGSSTEFSMSNLIKDLNNKVVNDGDTIIFVTSTPGRFHFQFQAGRPETASLYWHKVDESDPKNEWYQKNKKHIEWYILNFDCRINAMNHECYIHTLKNIAESYPKSKILVLSNSNHNTWNDINLELPFGKIPKNFLRPNIFLSTVSANEFINCESYTEFVKWTGWDPRINHLCNNNLTILSRLIVDSLNSGKVDNFKYDVFEKQVLSVINTKQMYRSYISRGLLYKIHGMEENLPG